MDAVLPQQYGIRKHPLFCLRALFRRCCGCCSSQGGRYGVSRQLLSKATRHARTGGGGTKGTTERAGQAASQDVAAAATSSGNTPLLHPDSLLTAHNGKYCVQALLGSLGGRHSHCLLQIQKTRMWQRSASMCKTWCQVPCPHYRVGGWVGSSCRLDASTRGQSKVTQPRSCCVLCMQVCPSTTQPMTIQSSFVDSTSALLASVAPRR